MAELSDGRRRRNYQVAELVTGCITMFLLKETSRNALNNDRDERFKSNYAKIFKLRLPHMDTVDDFLRLLPPDELEQLKAALVSSMIEQKMFHKFKLLGKHFMVAVDGTGVNSYDENDAEGSRTSKTSKNGTVTYSHYVVEAKLVTSSGLAISLASEWVANEPGRDFEKQDCEQKAFGRLAQKIKKHFPRLPICILADGLYPNKTFMKICAGNKWEFIVVLKDDNLKTLQEEIQDIEQKHRHSFECNTCMHKGKTHIHQKYEWISEPFIYSENTVYWLSCTETITKYDEKGKAMPPKKHKKKKRSGKEPATVTAKDESSTRFVTLTSVKVGKENVRDISIAGRKRWKIENKGFNDQKNHGYNLGHQYSRSTFNCYKNYYQCMQIAHMVNQLAEHSDFIAAMLEKYKKLTIKHLWKELICYLKMEIADETDFELNDRFQVRLAG
jgi:hypothetical protein